MTIKKRVQKEATLRIRDMPPGLWNRLQKDAKAEGRTLPKHCIFLLTKQLLNK